MHSNNNIVLAIPTKFEAIQVAKKFNINESKLNTNTLIKISENKFLIITGVGKKSIKAVETIHNKLSNAKIILMGFCGCSDTKISIGKAFVINKIKYLDEEMSLNDDKSFFKELDRICITTLDQYGKGSFVDMESYWFAKRCMELNIDFNIIRVVSDHCDLDPEHAKNVFMLKEKNIPECFVIAGDVMALLAI